MPESQPPRIPLVPVLKNRDLYLSKDPRLVNGYIEKKPDGTFFTYKRPAFKVATTVVGGGSDAGIIGGDGGSGTLTDGVTGSGSGSTGYGGLGGGGFGSGGINKYTTEYDPYWDYVVSLLHFDGSFKDEKGNGWSAVASPTISSGVKRFGSGSLDAANGFIVTPYQDKFIISGDFTIEYSVFFRYPMTTSGDVFSFTQWSSEEPSFFWEELFTEVGIAASLYSYTDLILNEVPLVTISISPGVWFSFAVTRQSNIYSIFINGTKSIYAESDSVYTLQLPSGYTRELQLGGFRSDNQLNFFGNYIDEFRFTNGICRYTSNYTPRTTPFPNR